MKSVRFQTPALNFRGMKHLVSNVASLDLGFFSCEMELVTPRALRGL